MRERERGRERGRGGGGRGELVRGVANVNAVRGGWVRVGVERESKNER